MIPVHSSFETCCATFMLDMAKFKLQQSGKSSASAFSPDSISQQWFRLSFDREHLGSLSDNDHLAFAIVQKKVGKFFSAYPIHPSSYEQVQATTPGASNVSALSLRAKSEGVICFYDDNTDSLTGCFGNFHICTNKIEFGGKHYSNSEAVFQAQKFKDNPSIFNQFNEHTDGDTAVRLGQTRLDAAQISKWDGEKDDVMMNTLRAKFGQNPTLKEMLLATENAYLMEHLPSPRRDKYWSDGYDGSGGNNLGICLMKLRAEYGGEGVVSRPAHNHAKFEKFYSSAPKPHYSIPSIFPEKTCKLAGCFNKAFSGHDFCGRTHANEFRNKHGHF